jgi:ATP/maltotriose-dependent transcriptional regulator MalT/DNA-binding SARP family transcriptional activator
VQGFRIRRGRLAGRVEAALRSGDLLLTAGAGCGKTTVLEQALSAEATPVAWIGCSEAARSPGRFLALIVRAIAAAVPGASDALAERLASGPDRIDALALTQELIAELSRLLVEPLIVVFDDAEHLDGADGSLRVVDELLRAELRLLHVAVASRRSLRLRVAKPRAHGRLTELTAADLLFDAEECAALLRLRTGLDPASERVEQVLEATEGWPLGIALAAGMVERGLAAGRAAVAFDSLAAAPDLRSYLSEELLRSLEPELAEAALESSITPTVTPEVVRALGLPEAFGAQIEAAGMLVRRLGDGGAFAYHPLLRDFLVERLRGEREESEWRRLHAAVAPALAGTGDSIGAVEHWLEGHRWAEVVAAIERDGPALIRTSPELVRRWLAALPAAQRGLPTMRVLEGQLDWLAGDNPGAIQAMREALRGFEESPNVPLEWVARSILVDLLYVTGGVEELEAVVAGWDGSAAAGAFDLAPAAALYAASVLATFARFDESERLAAAVRHRSDSELLAPFEALASLAVGLPSGEIDEACERLRTAVREMERFDPLHRRGHVLGALAVALAERGEPEEALRLWMLIRDIHGDGTSPVLADATHAWCALLHARAGRLAEAEAELARHRRLETGARSYIAELAPATVAALRGDASRTLAAADAALAIVADGPSLFRFLVGADLVPPLAAAGILVRAREVLAGTVALVDEHYPGPRGRFAMGRLVSLRAWLSTLEGDAARADADLRTLLDMSGEPLRHVLRREWERLERPIWDALERGAIEPAAAIVAIAAALPEGRQLVAFLDHPVAAVRTAALPPAVRSGDPRALTHLEGLAGDTDRGVAGAAAGLAGRLSISLPPLRFEVLGRFAVRRGSWATSEGAWGRPIDARLVRFLLVHLDRSVSEDELFDALWPDLSMASARRSLHVAASRVRQLLDPPGAERSVIERTERWYRLALDPKATVDADEFRAAVATALAERGEERRPLLERARSLWGGEPLPEERYSDWATPYREALIDRHTAVLTALVELDEHAGDHAQAADTARELVRLDPLNEGAHRALITAYARAGRTGQALRQYLECRRTLVEALGIEPAEATSRLQARILAGEPV